MSGKLRWVVAGLAMSVSSWAVAQDANPGAGGGANPGQQQGGRGQGRGFGAPGGGPGGQFGQFGGGGRDALVELVGTLGEADLDPAFELTKDQKEKIKAIRDGHKAKVEAWTKEHEADIKKLADQQRELRASFGQGGGGQGGGGDIREKFQALQQQRQTVYASAPKSDDAVKEIKAVLNETQGKLLDAKAAEHKAEQDKLRQEMQDRFGGGGRGGFGAPGGQGGGQGGQQQQGGRGGRGGRGGGQGGGGGQAAPGAGGAGVPNGL